MTEHIRHFVLTLKGIDFVTAWKAISIVLTGAFGILGLATDFKNKHTHKITPWGWVSLVGIVVSSFFGVAAQLKESSDAATTALKVAQKSDATLNDIQRLLTQISEPTVAIRYTVQCAKAPYWAEEFCADASNVQDELTSMNYSIPGNEQKGYKLGADKKVWKSWPVFEEGKFLDVTLRFFKDSAAAQEYADDKGGEPDMEIEVRSLLKDKFTEKLALGITFQSPEIVTVNENLSVNEVVKNEKITSFHDLAGATLLIGCTDYCSTLFSILRPEHIYISNQQGLGIEIKDFELVGDPTSGNVGQLFYRHTFPRDLVTPQSSGSLATPSPAAQGPRSK